MVRTVLVVSVLVGGAARADVVVPDITIGPYSMFSVETAPIVMRDVTVSPELRAWPSCATMPGGWFRFRLETDPDHPTQLRLKHVPSGAIWKITANGPSASNSYDAFGVYTGTIQTQRLDAQYSEGFGPTRRLDHKMTLEKLDPSTFRMHYALIGSEDVYPGRSWRATCRDSTRGAVVQM